VREDTSDNGMRSLGGKEALGRESSVMIYPSMLDAGVGCDESVFLVTVGTLHTKNKKKPTNLFREGIK